MTVFAVLLPDADQPALVDKIKTEFSQDFYEVTEKQFLVSAYATTGEVSAKLGIFDPLHPDAASVGNGIVFAVQTYTGRAPGAVWEWLVSKLESKVGG